MNKYIKNMMKDVAIMKKEQEFLNDIGRRAALFYEGRRIRKRHET